MSMPMTISLSYWWNLGSMLGMILFWQIITGLLLVMFYTCDALEAFMSIEYVMREVNGGWFLRVAHFNGASLFLVFLYLHMARGVAVGSWRLWKVWSTGMLLFIFVMGEAFLGYVLPWGQMSVWGACVITSLLSVVPLIGEDFVMWIWGGFVVNSATLGCFLMVHLLLPLIILVSVVLHLLFLHEMGSSNSCGGTDSELKIKFFPFFLMKDAINLSLWGALLVMICWAPFYLGDCENLKEANLMSSPVHIQPEWYFLLLYAILRAVPNKLGGVALLALSLVAIWTLCFFPFNFQANLIWINSILMSSMMVITLLLTFLGASPVEIPFIFMSQIMTMSYFASLMGVFSLWLNFW